MNWDINEYENKKTINEAFAELEKIIMENNPSPSPLWRLFFSKEESENNSNIKIKKKPKNNKCKRFKKNRNK